MNNLTNAVAVYKNLVKIGYILQISSEYYLPLDSKGENISGPTYKKDALHIVKSLHRTLKSAPKG
jgi:hypothetical protein